MIAELAQGATPEGGLAEGVFCCSGALMIVEDQKRVAPVLVWDILGHDEVKGLQTCERTLFKHNHSAPFILQQIRHHGSDGRQVPKAGPAS